VTSQNPSVVLPHRVFRKARYGSDKFILVGKYKIHYVEAGQGEPVILIPGSFGTYRAWNRLMPLLGKEYRLLALDYLSVGDSDKTGKGFEYTIQEQTDLIAAMVRQLEMPGVDLIGGSYSGAIVFDFAARYPDLIGKMVSIEGGVIRSVDSGAKTASSIPWYKISLARKTSHSLEEEAKKIKSPVLYLYGTRSDFKGILLDKNLEFLKKYLPHAWIVEVEGGIHDLALQKPAEVADLILEFLHPRPAPRFTVPETKK
jgi:pimeloyl-ACP methyl ester carboxylesterase